MKYTKDLEKNFFSAKHVGSLEREQKNTKHVRIGSSQQREFFDLYALFNEEGKILKACFKAQGNPYLIASLEWICSKLEGASINTLNSFDISTLCQKFKIPESYYPTAIQVEKGYNEIIRLIKENQDE